MDLNTARESSAIFVRSIDAGARRLWETKGPKNTDIAIMEAWVVTPESQRTRILVIQHFGARNPKHSGWMVLAEVGPNEIKGTRRCVLALDALEKA